MSMYSYPRLAILRRAPINFSTSGDNTIIASDPSNRIVVHRLWFVVNADTNLTFKDNLPSPAAVPMGAKGALVFDTSGEPWFVTDIGSAFIINSSAAVQVSGEVRYLLQK